MMNRNTSRTEFDPNTLDQALRALPDHAPDADTFARIRTRIALRRRRRRLLRTGLPLAMAASLLVALGIGLAVRNYRTTPLAGPAQTNPARVAVTHDGITLAQLQNHSMRLEQWLGELRANGAPLQGPALASAVGLQDRISLIDLQLAAPGHAGNRRALWQQRIRLLQDLAMLRATQSPLSGRPVMAESGSATFRF
jgi:hypothetical protein